MSVYIKRTLGGVDQWINLTPDIFEQNTFYAKTSSSTWTDIQKVYVKTGSSTWAQVYTAVYNIRGNNSPTDSAYVSSTTYGNTKDGSLGDTSTYDILYVSLSQSIVGASRIINFDSTSTSSSTLYLQYGGEGYDGGYYTTATAYLKYSTDGGSTYTTIATITHTSGSTGPTSYSVALPANVNLSNVKVKYEVDQSYTSVETDCIAYDYGPPPDYTPYCIQYAYDDIYSTAQVKIYDCYIKYFV